MNSDPGAGPSGRPPVSVVIPFLGTDADLARLLTRLARIHRTTEDEIIVADNRTTGPVEPLGGEIILHPAGGVRSPGFARNRGAAVAARDWLVFIDSDTDPAEDLLDRYFDPAPAAGTGVVGGAIVDVLPEPAPGAAGRPALAARYAVTRRHMSHGVTLDRPAFPYAQSGNCAIRRQAFVDVGGFEETVRAAEDADLCFRLSAAGWGLETRAGARVTHEARSTTIEALRQLSRHGAGAAWCNRRHPGSFPPPTVLGFAVRLARNAVRGLAAAIRGDREVAAFAALEILEAIAFEFGRLLPNRARR